MKKRFLAIAFAAVLAFVLPMTAFAYQSPIAEDMNDSGDGLVITNIVYDANQTESSVTMYGDIVKGGASVEENVALFKLVTEAGVDLNARITDQKAKNFEERDYVSVHSFQVESPNYEKGDKVTIAYYAGKDNVGLKCYIFVEHSDGSVETFEKDVDRDGMVEFDMKNMSIITMAIAKNDTVKTTAAVKAQDNTSKSPKTGGVL